VCPEPRHRAIEAPLRRHRGAIKPAIEPAIEPAIKPAID